MLNRVKVWFVPREAQQIAAEFEQQANNVRQEVQRLQQIRSNLAENWMGNSANQFQSEAEPKVKELLNFADWLSIKANEIRNKEVWEWREPGK